MKIDVEFKADKLLEELKLGSLPEEILKGYNVDRRTEVKLVAEVDCDAVWDEFPEDFVDDKFEQRRDDNEPSLFDLKDGLDALAKGDRAMAAILLARAFEQWPDAVRVIEDALRKSTAPAKEQFPLFYTC